jgi:hypothetical protein
LKYKCVFSHLHKCLNNNHMLHLQVFILLKQQKHWKICHLKWSFQLFFQFQVEPSGHEGFINRCHSISVLWNRLSLETRAQSEGGATWDLNCHNSPPFNFRKP